MKRRENGRIPCNQSIENEDTFVKETFMTSEECVPSYWKNLTSNWTQSYSMPLCQREQYGSIYNSLENRGSKKNNLYLHPCSEMHFNAIHKNTIHVPLLNKWEYGLLGAISFHYTTDLYKEIVDQQKFTFETLFGQIGGFVG